MEKKRVGGSLLLTLVAFIWGSAFVVQRVGMESIEPITFTAARMSLAAVAVGMVAMCRGKMAVFVRWDRRILPDLPDLAQDNGN